jgi:hypothetical protein
MFVDEKNFPLPTFYKAREQMVHFLRGFVFVCLCDRICFTDLQ